MNTLVRMTTQAATIPPRRQTAFNEIRSEVETKIKANDLLVAKIQKQTSLSLEDFITEVAKEQMKLDTMKAMLNDLELLAEK